MEKNKAFKQVILSHFIKNVKDELPPNFEDNDSFKYYIDFIQTIQNREVRYKRGVLLKRLNKCFSIGGIKAEYYTNNKGGFIQIEKNKDTFKIRIENKKFQIEKWSHKTEKKIISYFDLDTDLEKIKRNVLSLKNWR
ncbi:hypothetical protein SAMN05444411_106206 [Lutibacter oricola]|uniref:Uncharacterized protein n=1 Tax=Lutibacter oricola TaxID=762486 RepID=A0A1H3CPK6_9FLAO|nr:hypothetical protein SAMN05444411_106206 [Lutibacter oricola]